VGVRARKSAAARGIVEECGRVKRLGRAKLSDEGESGLGTPHKAVIVAVKTKTGILRVERGV